MERCPYCEFDIPESEFEDAMCESMAEDGDTFDFSCPKCGRTLDVTVWVSYNFDVEKGDCPNHTPGLCTTTPEDVANGITRFVCAECGEDITERSQNGILNFDVDSSTPTV